MLGWATPGPSPGERSAHHPPHYAGRVPVELSDAEFDALVALALDDLPEQLSVLVRNVVVLVEEFAPPEDPDLLGYYDGVALTEREANHAGFLPDRILLFREPLSDMCASLSELAEEVRITVVHEIAHHFGIDDDRLEQLGWD